MIVHGCPTRGRPGLLSFSAHARVGDLGVGEFALLIWQPASDLYLRPGQKHTFQNTEYRMYFVYTDIVEFRK